MEKRTLGETDLKVTTICLGTMTWGHQNTEEEAHEQLDYALNEGGINFIDTAEVYAVPPQPDTQGFTETYIGNWLEKSGKRDEIIIATKMVSKGVPWIRDGRGLVKDDIKEAIEGSLKRLKTDYIDLYQLHWPQRDVAKFGKLHYDESMYKGFENAEDEILEMLKGLDEAIKEGKIKHFGLSNETPWGTMKFIQLAEKHNLPKVQSIQNPYSLVQRSYDNGMSEVSMQENVGLLAYSPLAGGVLSGKYLNGALPEGARYSTWGKDRMPQYQFGRVEEAVKEYKKIADKLSISLTKLSLAFVTQRGFVTSNIIGATKMDQLKECIESADITLSEETLKEIDDVFNMYPNPATAS